MVGIEEQERQKERGWVGTMEVGVALPLGWGLDDSGRC